MKVYNLEKFNHFLRNMYQVILLYAFFASVFTISKFGLEYTEPFFLVGSRMLLAGIILLGYSFFRERDKISISKQMIYRLLRLALVNIYLVNTFEFWGLKYLTSFKTCFIYSLSPFLSALFAYFMLSERMTPRKWTGLVVGFLGIIPVLMFQSGEETEAGQLLYLSWPEIAVMVAALCSVLGWIFLKQLVSENGCSPMFANGVSMLIGGVGALAHSYLVEPWNPVPVLEWIPFIESALLLILISNIICYNLYGHLLKKFSATFISFAGFTTPFFSALFGWFFLGEVVAMPYYFSLTVVMVGLLLFHQEELLGKPEMVQ